jgi:antitoxin FitA
MDMADLVVKNLENVVKARLQHRARRHGRSLEEEVRDILRAAVSREELPSRGLGSDIARLFEKAGLTSEVAELLGHRIAPAEFKP